MNLSLGIVGLPNVGKSTLFNALTKQTVPAENYPFTTIDPNVGVVAVADERLYKISEIAKPAKTIPAVVEFVDIAGLIKGAAEGEGLGNKFLSNIKEVSAIIHVVRAFDNTNITHVENSVDPKRDIELINTELILKDLETLQNRISALQSKSRFDKDVNDQVTFLKELMSYLESGKLGVDFRPETLNYRDMTTFKTLKEARRELFLLTDKPVIYLVNTDEDGSSLRIKAIKEVVGDKPMILIDIKTEYDLASMTDEERVEFMEELGIEKTGLERLTKAAYELLGLISYFTEGPEEVRAWTIKKGAKAPEAAGTIHTDFEKKFIAAEVCAYQDFVSAGSWNQAKSNGKVRLEGKEYTFQDGDITVFRHG